MSQSHVSFKRVFRELFSGAILNKSRFLISFCSKLSVLFWVSIRRATCLPCAMVQVHVDHFGSAVCLFHSSVSTQLACALLASLPFVVAVCLSSVFRGFPQPQRLMLLFSVSWLSAMSPATSQNLSVVPLVQQVLCYLTSPAGNRGSLLVSRVKWRWFCEDCPQVGQGTTLATFSNCLRLCLKEGGWCWGNLYTFSSPWAAKALEGTRVKILLMPFVQLCLT